MTSSPPPAGRHWLRIGSPTVKSTGATSVGVVETTSSSDDATDTTVGKPGLPDQGGGWPPRGGHNPHYAPDFQHHAAVWSRLSRPVSTARGAARCKTALESLLAPRSFSLTAAGIMHPHELFIVELGTPLACPNPSSARRCWNRARPTICEYLDSGKNAERGRIIRNGRVSRTSPSRATAR